MTEEIEDRLINIMMLSNMTLDLMAAIITLINHRNPQVAEKAVLHFEEMERNNEEITPNMIMEYIGDMIWKM